MSRNAAAGSACPIAWALSVVGDRWTLLILREFSMGARRFDELQAQTGMSSHLLASRLKRLEKDGIVERSRYNERPARYDYLITEKGQALDPVLFNLRAWGMQWGGFDPKLEPAVTMIYQATGEAAGVDWQPPAHAPPLRLTQFDSTLGEAFRAEREANLSRFQAAKKAVRATGLPSRRSPD